MFMSKKARKTGAEILAMLFTVIALMLLALNGFRTEADLKINDRNGSSINRLYDQLADMAAEVSESDDAQNDIVRSHSDKKNNGSLGHYFGITPLYTHIIGSLTAGMSAILMSASSCLTAGDRHIFYLKLQDGMK